MSAGPMDGAPDRCEFVVRPDGTVVGDDGAAGALAGALPYTGRLARRAGELVEVGDLRALEALGARRLTVGVTWTPAGEGTYRAVLVPAEPRTLPSFMVVGGADTAATVAHCVDRVLAVGGVRWSGIVTAGSRVVASAGDGAATSRLAEVGNRMLAILRSLEDQHVAGFVRLRFEKASVVGASLGRHALVACAGVTDDEDLLATIDEVRAILADRDLSTVPTPQDPAAHEAAADESTDESAVEIEVTATPAPPPLVGARFAGAGTRQPRTGRRRFGRGSLSPSPGGTPRRSTRG
ncbi:hypothetical protein NYO98_06250 [Nocardioides sp. STR2]|uniref:Uncharacterized protein n=1 Tax=Nocardioides pini TaxID=2975053 RepID=A0ABT4CA82_9ACTN|nr:hypothetical protein [Nocardioides pini]MCY4725875.1 hypothetical protein [Nocardioides pini]